MVLVCIAVDVLQIAAFRGLLNNPENCTSEKKLVINNYMPILNMAINSFNQLLRKLSLNNIICFLATNNSIDISTSGFGLHHSSETALIKVLNDINLSIDSGKVSVLFILDLNSAFDTV